MNLIYLDNAATTKVDSRVVEAMLPYFLENYGNDETVYSAGRTAKKAVSLARKQVAGTMNADAEQIFFTSCGCEANTWAIMSALNTNRGKNHIIISSIEHSSIMNLAKYLEKYKGITVTRLAVDEKAKADISNLDSLITKNTAVVSVMHTNNETGTRQPAEEIAQICRDKNTQYHMDFVAGFGKEKIDLKKMPADFVSVSAHKIHAPKGIGALYIKDKSKAAPLIFGGSQESSLRGGTLNVPYIAGFGKACELMDKDFEKNYEHIKALRDYLASSLSENIKGLKINTPLEISSPAVLNVSLPDLPSNQAIVLLDKKGICVSSGSACEAGDVSVSHVLAAMGIKAPFLQNSLRFSLSRFTTKAEIDIAVEELKKIA